MRRRLRRRQSPELLAAVAIVHTNAILERYFEDVGAKLRHAPVSRGPRQATKALRGEVLRVLDDHDVVMSTRQLYYQLVSRAVVENTARSYDRVQRLLVTMRRDHAIEYGRIVDRTRSKHQRAGWDGVGEVMRAVHGQYRRDVWSEQDTIVMVACEKQALEGVFAEVVDEYGAQLWILRGFGSESFAFEWATAIKRFAAAGKSVVVAYFGDFDPSGLAIEQDARTKLRSHGASFEWQRHGLLISDFDRFDLVNVPVKRTRAKKYLAGLGDRAAELDALPPDELHRRVRACMAEHLDHDALTRLRAQEIAERESLGMVAGHWEAAVAGARDAAASLPLG